MKRFWHRLWVRFRWWSFPATRHSMVKGHKAGTEESWQWLMQAYAGPLYHSLRDSGYAEGSARQLSLGFFSYALTERFFEKYDPERGKKKFRNYLVGWFQNYLLKEHASERRLTTCPTPESIPSVSVIEDLVNRHWAHEVLEEAIARLQRSLQRRSPNPRIRARRLRVLKAYLLTIEPDLPATLVSAEIDARVQSVLADETHRKLGVRALLARALDEPEDTVNNDLNAVRPEFERHLCDVARERRAEDGDLTRLGVQMDRGA